MKVITIKTYVAVNLLIAAIVILIIIYSAVFSADKDNYPVESAYSDNGCISTGISHSFSEIVRLRFNSAAGYNSQGLKIFIFFFSQLILRIVFTFLYLKRAASPKFLFIFDSVISLTLFIFTFEKFIVYTFCS